MLVQGRWLRNSPCGLKHARHPLACGQGQTRPSLRACDANKAPSQIPPQPFSASLAACPGRWDAAHPLANTTRASSLRTPPAGHQGLSGPAAGRLVGAEQRSGEVGARSALRSSDWPRLFERSGRGPRSELRGPTSPRAAQGSPAGGGTGNKEARPQVHSDPAPRCPEKVHRNRQADNARNTPHHYVCTKITRISKKDQANLPV